ncbi:hypothetical protein K1T71_013679 [Dendrolimus kikuchii]|uniref:Uncharacterized protein n=1 Tax=Dendrolimus kikuchii TaxID=765133 RepID=A0ACC1CHH4_9NEOP|nr:hypothetical protein K1T71_013679 [Dendrolimus kikuchii]
MSVTTFKLLIHMVADYSFFLIEVLAKSQVRNFPEDFQFGATTSAYQVEGAWNEDGKGPSIWDTATHANPSPITDGSNGDIAADFYHNYISDVDNMKKLHLDVFRFSISWSRVLPNGFSDKVNQLGIDFYNKVIKELLINSIRPAVTMYNWDLPSNLQKLGGWTNPLIVVWFADYAKVLFDHFGDRIKDWITINDPKEVCAGYGTNKAPFLNMSGIGEYICLKNILLAHANVYHLYDEHYRKLQQGLVSISIDCTWFEPASESIEDMHAARDARMFDWGQFAHPIFSREGDYPIELKRNIALRSAEQGFPRTRLLELSAAEVVNIRGTSDYFGLSTFTTRMAYRDASLEGMYPNPSFLDDIGAVIVRDPSSLHVQTAWIQEGPYAYYLKLFKEIKKLYNNPPIYITGNGLATDGSILDDDRISYTNNILNAVLDGISQGCDVRGYSVWSLLDSFEWTNGYTTKYGLFQIDFSSPERNRVPRKSAFIYKQMLKTRTLDFNYEPDNESVESEQL